MPKDCSWGGGTLPRGGCQVLRCQSHGVSLACFHPNLDRLAEGRGERGDPWGRSFPHRGLPTVAVSALCARSNILCDFKAILTSPACLPASPQPVHPSYCLASCLGHGNSGSPTQFAIPELISQAPQPPINNIIIIIIKVNEELCYGTTLGLQSSPPEEPCQLAHSLIRLVRFSSFLSRLPHSSSSSGFGGGGASSANSWDRGLVGRAVLIVLKCVALTTREARVESSSGESDSSMSSRWRLEAGIPIRVTLNL